MALDRTVDEALHEPAEHRRRDNGSHCGNGPRHVQLREKPPIDIAADCEGRTVRDMEDLGRAEDQGETDRSQRIDRAELQPVEEELKKHHARSREEPRGYLMSLPDPLPSISRI